MKKNLNFKSIKFCALILKFPSHFYRKTKHGGREKNFIFHPQAIILSEMEEKFHLTSS